MPVGDSVVAYSSSFWVNILLCMSSTLFASSDYRPNHVMPCPFFSFELTTAAFLHSFLISFCATPPATSHYDSVIHRPIIRLIRIQCRMLHCSSHSASSFFSLYACRIYTSVSSLIHHPALHLLWYILIHSTIHTYYITQTLFFLFQLSSSTEPIVAFITNPTRVLISFFPSWLPYSYLTRVVRVTSDVAGSDRLHVHPYCLPYIPTYSTLLPLYYNHP